MSVKTEKARKTNAESHEKKSELGSISRRNTIITDMDMAEEKWYYQVLAHDNQKMYVRVEGTYESE